MYSNPGGRQADYLSTSPQWQTINRSMNALVDDGEERARAASAPPPQQLTGFQYHDRGQTPVDQWTDIRCDDEYENFYKASTAAGRRLPPPLDAGAMYSQLPNHLQHLTAQQQLLAARASPNPTGLETINERPGSNINPQILQVLNQINQERGASPAPPAGLDYTNPLPPLDNGLDNSSAMLQQLIAAAGSLSLSATPQPPQSLTPPVNAGTPPLPSATPPLPPQINQHNPQAMANAAAYAATIAAGQQNTGMQDFRRTMEWNTVYSAAYQAALHQQQAATQNLLLSQGQGHMASQLAGQYAPQHSHVAAQIAGQMAMNPSFLGTQNIGQVAAAAATAAVQNMMAGRGAPGMYGDYDRGDRDDRRHRMGGNRRGNRRDLDRDRDRDDDGGSNFRYQTLEEVIGQVMTVAKDQNGCRFLQRKFDEGGHEAIATVFPEILDNLIDLMTDPFGNYLTQKLLDRCSEQQRLEVLRRAAQDGSLVKVALNTHGTRAVQKLIETLQGPEQIQLVIKALKPGVVALIRDLNGNHVIQRCLQRLGPEDSQFVYDAASEHAVEIATHRHGCCVLQRCIDFATASQKDELVAKIVDNAYALSQDGFGNYCLQYVLELDQVETSKEILRRLTTHFPELSQQKFSSNVVEKCLKLKNPEYNEFKEIIVREIIQSPFLSRLLQDPYANFVIQTALGESKDTLHTELVEAIKPFLPSLRGTPFGKKILAKINIKL